MLCWFENINETWPGKWKAFKLRTFCVCVRVIEVFLWTEFESLILSTKTCIFSYIKSLVSLISNECNIWYMISFDCKFLEKYLFESFLMQVLRDIFCRHQDFNAWNIGKRNSLPHILFLIPHILLVILNMIILSSFKCRNSQLRCSVRKLSFYHIISGVL